MEDFVYQPPDLDGSVAAALDGLFRTSGSEVTLAEGVKARVYRAEHSIAVTVGLHPLNEEVVIRSAPADEAATLEVLEAVTGAVLAHRFPVSPPMVLPLAEPQLDVHGVLLVADREMPVVAVSFGELALLEAVPLGRADLAKLRSGDNSFDAQERERAQRKLAAKAVAAKPGRWLASPGKTSRLFGPKLIKPPALPADAQPIDRAWARLEAWLSAAAPKKSKKLEPPAQPAELDALEQEVGAPLPDELRRSLLRHDGLPKLPDFFPGSYTLCSVKQMRAALADTREAARREWSAERAVAHGPVRAAGWDPMWLPLTSGEGRYYLCVDLNPPPEGTRGQIIEVGRHEDRSWVTSSWAEYLESVTTKLMGDDYAFE